MTASFKIKKHQKIGIFAPAGRVDKAQIGDGVSILKKAGFDVFAHEQTYMRDHQMAGTPEQKAKAFNDLLEDSSIDAIMAARGGNQAAQIIPHLDKELAFNSDKTLIGFSDFSYILNAFSETQMTMIHGPMAQTLPSTHPDDIKILLSLLQGDDVTDEYQKRFEQSHIVKKGEASGTLYGGCLPLMQTLLGTKYSPFENGEDIILFLEDLYEETNRWDRMLFHLKTAIPADKLKGIIFGNFSKALDSGDPFGYEIDDIIKNHFGHLDIPVIAKAPFGHEKDNLFMPIGCSVNLSASGDKPLIKLG